MNLQIIAVLVIGLICVCFAIYKIAELYVLGPEPDHESKCAHEWVKIEEESLDYILGNDPDKKPIMGKYKVVVYKCEMCGEISKIALK
jgi:hypothetical protein